MPGLLICPTRMEIPSKERQVIDPKLRTKTAVRGLSVFAGLAQLATAWLGAGATVAARSVGLDSPEIYTLHRRANTADDGRPSIGSNRATERKERRMNALMSDSELVSANIGNLCEDP